LIYVVGCNHGIQPRDQDALFGDTSQARDQKSHFTTLIEEIIKGHKIQFVGEEWGLQETTIARASAGNGVRWANINTSREDLREMGIPPDYLKGEYSSGQKAQWNRQREQVMLRKIQEYKGDTERLLVVCGFEHLQPLAELLLKINTSVATIDYRNLSWYQPNVFTDDS